MVIADSPVFSMFCFPLDEVAKDELPFTLSGITFDKITTADEGVVSRYVWHQCR